MDVSEGAAYARIYNKNAPDFYFGECRPCNKNRGGTGRLCLFGSAVLESIEALPVIVLPPQTNAQYLQVAL